jgi:hypothetical protein
MSTGAGDLPGTGTAGHLRRLPNSTLTSRYLDGAALPNIRWGSQRTENSAFVVVVVVLKVDWWKLGFTRFISGNHRHMRS